MTTATGTTMTTTASISPTPHFTDFSQSLGTGETASSAGPAASSFFAAASDTALQNSNSGAASDDKYTVFSKASRQMYKGWSTRVLHGSDNKFGWSDELLEYGSNSDETMSSGAEEDDEQEASGGNEATAAGKWLKGSSWNTSPRRTFVRNFP